MPSLHLSKIPFYGFFLSFFLISTAFNAAFGKNFHVIIDPGHGGQDGGAIHNHFRESQLVLKYSQELRSKLKQDSSIQVTLTRQEDRFIKLEDRSNLAKKKKADLFISLHLNSNDDPRVRGTEIYTAHTMAPDEETLFLANRENQQNNSGDGYGEIASNFATEIRTIVEDLQKPFFLKESLRFAETLQSTFNAELPKQRILMRQGPFRVLMETACPSILIELGFLSHAEEARWLGTSEANQKIAEILFQTIQSYREKIDKQKAPVHIVEHAHRWKTL